MKLGIAAVVVGLSVCPRAALACKTPPPCVALAPMDSAETAVTALESSSADAAARAALTLARSSAPDELRALGRALGRTETLAQILKLDAGKRCVMPQVLATLAGNSKGEARTLFVSLTSAPAWAEDPNRWDGADLTEILLRATGGFRPPTPEVVAFWKRLSLPDGGWVNVAAMALTENGSEAAVKQFEALLRNPKHGIDERIGWLGRDYIAHRDNALLLNLANRLLDSGLPAKLKTAIADTTFDIHIENYSTCGPPAIPAFASFPPNARKELRAIATKLRARKPNPRLARAIAAALEQLSVPPSG